jgi:P27 family predicted phage terminase small subunit
MAPVPKRPEDRHRAPKRPELGLVEAPASDFVIPAPPPDLLKASQARWEAYWRSAVSSAVDMNADRGLLERWIRSVDEWYRAYRSFRKERTTQGSTGQLVLSPLAKWIRQLEGEISKCEQQMGLTPLARVKLGLVAGQARLTADLLNKSLSEDDEPDPDRAAIDGEWEEA